MTEETLPAVTAAREALASIEALHPTAPIAVGSSTHGGPIQYDDGCRIHGAWCRDWTILQRDTAKLRDLLAVVDRLTAPVTGAEVEALAKVIDANQTRRVFRDGDPYGSTVFNSGATIAAAIVAASGRRHLPTEPDEREWGLISPDAHPGQYGRDDRAHLVSRNREHVERQHRRGHPSIMLAHRRAPGPWEVCDEQ